MCTLALLVRYRFALLGYADSANVKQSTAFLKSPCLYAAFAALLKASAASFPLLIAAMYQLCCHTLSCVMYISSSLYQELGRLRKQAEHHVSCPHQLQLRRGRAYKFSYIQKYYVLEKMFLSCWGSRMGYVHKTR
jgi:hypothetical protein